MVGIMLGMFTVFPIVAAPREQYSLLLDNIEQADYATFDVKVSPRNTSNPTTFSDLL